MPSDSANWVRSDSDPPCLSAWVLVRLGLTLPSVAAPSHSSRTPRSSFSTDFSSSFGCAFRETGSDSAVAASRESRSDLAGRSRREVASMYLEMPTRLAAGPRVRNSRSRISSSLNDRSFWLPSRLRDCFDCSRTRRFPPSPSYFPFLLLRFPLPLPSPLPFPLPPPPSPSPPADMLRLRRRCRLTPWCLESDSSEKLLEIQKMKKSD